jgi:Recombination endonuclease VII.
VTSRMCGRPTKKGSACTARPMNWCWIPDAAREKASHHLPQSCYGHLTASEKQLFTLTREAYEERQQRAQERFMESEPACWSWPVPADLDSWELPLPFSVGPGDDQISQATADLLAASQCAGEGRADALLEAWQDGRCALCGRRRDLVQDHDHATGLVRGWLCVGCNTKEGIYHQQRRGPYARYRERHPTRILGLRIRYWDLIAGDYAAPQPAALARDQDADAWIDCASRGIGL